MPGEFESDGKGWKPALVARCENGRIRASSLKDRRLLDQTVKYLDGGIGPGGRRIELPVTLRESLGSVLEVPDPAAPGRMIPFLEPDPAAVEAIRKMTGDETSDVLPAMAPPEAKAPQVTVVNAAGQDARDAELSELRATVKQQGELLKSLAEVGRKRGRKPLSVGA